MASVDREVVRGRIERLLHEVDAIAERTPPEYEAYAAPDAEALRYELEHRLLIALQAVIDISTHVAVVSGVRPLDTYRDCVMAMRALDVVPSELGERLAPAVGLRNVLVHEYQAVDGRFVHAALADAGTLRAFAAAVWRWIERGGGR